MRRRALLGGGAAAAAGAGAAPSARGPAVALAPPAPVALAAPWRVGRRWPAARAPPHGGHAPPAPRRLAAPACAASLCVGVRAAARAAARAAVRAARAAGGRRRGERSARAGRRGRPAAATVLERDTQADAFIEVGEPYVVGDWSGWDFERMAPCEDEPGAFAVEVELLWTEAEFQVVCDRDWARRVHPRWPTAKHSVALGPDDRGHGLNWRLSGRIGDVVRIELRLQRRDDATGGAAMSWHHVRSASAARRRALEAQAAQDAGEEEAPEYEPPPPPAAAWERALHRLSDVLRYGGTPDDWSLNSVFEACEKEGAWQASLAMLEHMWSRDRQSVGPKASHYESVAKSCKRAGERSRAASLLSEVRSWNVPRGQDEALRPVRFHLAPRVYWNRDVKRIGCDARNTLDWRGGEPVPEPDRPSTWLLPASDHVALEIARLGPQLRAAGWKVLTGDACTVQRLENKAMFQAYGAEIGMGAYLPKSYTEPWGADYPCILKPATGEFGADIRIVRSPLEVERALGKQTLGEQLLLQELVTGRYEYSAAMLVLDGRILDMACTRYEYDAEEYVWPRVNEVERSPDGVSLEHTAIMSAFLTGYSGFCNFNYKIAADGSIRMFEVNTRIGADFACDVPRAKARAMLERLDALDLPPPRPAGRRRGRPPGARAAGAARR